MLKVIVVRWFVIMLDGIKSQLLECVMQHWEFQGLCSRAKKVGWTVFICRRVSHRQTWSDIFKKLSFLVADRLLHASVSLLVLAPA